MSDNTAIDFIDFMAAANAAPAEKPQGVPGDEKPGFMGQTYVTEPGEKNLPVIADSLDMVPVRRDMAQYEKQINDLVAQAKAIEVNGDASAETATALGTTISKLSKAIEKRRLEIAAPSLEFQRKVKALGDKLRKPLDEAVADLKRQIVAYNRQKEIEALAAEKKARETEAKRQAALEQMAEEAGVEAPAPEPMPEPVMSHKTEIIRTEAGSASTSKRWTFEIINADEIPREYLTPDEKAIGAAVRSGGVRNIPGVRIFQDNKVAFR